MKILCRRILSILLALTIVWTNAEVSSFAVNAKTEDSEIILDYDDEDAIPLSDGSEEEIPQLGGKAKEYIEKVVYNSSTKFSGGDPRKILDNIDIRKADYVKVKGSVGGYHIASNRMVPYRSKRYSILLINSATNKNIAPTITGDSDSSFWDQEITVCIWRGDNESWNYSNASIWAGVKALDFSNSDAYMEIKNISLGYGTYVFKIDQGPDNISGYREKIYTGEGKYDSGPLVRYPQSYFTSESSHVTEKKFSIGEKVSASVWEGGGTNSQNVTANSGTVNYKGFKLLKPGTTDSLSGFVTTSDNFLFDVGFINKYKDYLSDDGTFTLVPIYEPKGQALQFLNDNGSVNGKADVKGVYEGFSTGYTLNATKLDTIRIGAKANPKYQVSSIVVQCPAGAWENAAQKKYWTKWNTIKSSEKADNRAELSSAINCRGQMYLNATFTSWGVRDYGRVLINYSNVSGSLTMAPSPQSMNEGADGKLTFIKGPGAENNPYYNTTVKAGTTIKIDDLHLFKPYIFSATSKSGFHAYWKDGTLDTNGDGAEDIRIPGYEPFRNTFGDQFKFIPAVPVNNKVYYNFVKDVNVAKEVKSLPLKGYLLLNDSLLLSGKKVQKGLGGITVFASGFKAGQEVTTNADGYYELVSNDRFKYYDLYEYNVTFTGENEVGTIGVVYSQNPNRLGEVIVDATADVDISDVKLLIEQNKKDGSGKEYLTVDTTDALSSSSGGYYHLPGGDRNYRLRMSAHRNSEVLTRGVITFTNTNGSKVLIEGTEDAAHSGLFTFDFNPKAKGIGSGATARLAFYTGEHALLSRDCGIKVADGIGTIRIVNALTGASFVQPLGISEDAASAADLIAASGQPITMDFSGDFDDITDSPVNSYMDGEDRVICVGFVRKILSAGGEKDMLMELARSAAMAQDEEGEAADTYLKLKEQIAGASVADKSVLADKLKDAENELTAKKEEATKAQNRLDAKVAAIRSSYSQQEKFDSSLPMDLKYSLLMTFGYDDENGMWYFKDMLCISSVEADSDAAVSFDTGLGLTAGVNKHLSANGRATLVVEQRQDLTDEGRKDKRIYITSDNKDSFDIVSYAGEGEERRLDSYGRLNLDPEITLTGCMGLAGDLVQVDVDGRAEYGSGYGAALDGTGTYSLNASVKIRTMNYTDRIPLINGIYQIAETSLGSDKTYESVDCDKTGFLSRSVDTLEAEDVSYLEGEDSWNGALEDAEQETSQEDINEFYAIDDGGFEAYKESTLANRIVPDAGYDMVSLGDGRFAAVFLNAPQNRIRDKDNARAAFYTYYDGSNWSTPMLLEDDGTLDLYPHIYPLDGSGALIVWSTVDEEYKAADDKIARQNALDLRGRFVNADGSLNDSILMITGNDMDAETLGKASVDDISVGEASEIEVSANNGYADEEFVEVEKVDDEPVDAAAVKAEPSNEEQEVVELAADRAIGVSLSKDKLVVVYEKRRYEVSEAEATLGDMLYPKNSKIAYRTYDLTTGKLGTEHVFDGFLPGVELYEDLDDTGYYRAGGSATEAVKLDDPLRGMLLDSDMATFTVGDKDKGVLAYTVDIDGNLSSACKRELYLATYDFDTESFSQPVILTGYNVNTLISCSAYSENSSPRFVSAADNLYLMWLRDGSIVSINAGNLLLDEATLVKEGQMQGISYRYIDKTPYQEGMTALYDAPSVLVSGGRPADADSYQIGDISAFNAETDGRYIYVIWLQAADDKPESLQDSLKDIQMWGIRTLVTEGLLSEMTTPVQITSHYGKRYDDVTFGVYDGEVYGMASKIPSRMITQSEAREVFAESFDENTFAPYAIWDDTGAAPVAFRINEKGTARIKNAGFVSAVAGEGAVFSFDIHNYSFSDLSGAKVTAIDKNGNSCILYQYVPSKEQETQGDTIASQEVVINALSGGDRCTITGYLPLSEDADSTQVTIGIKDADDNPMDYTYIKSELSSEIILKDISITDTSARNLYKVKGRVINEGTARLEAGVIDLIVQKNAVDKTLRQISYPALMPGESYDFNEENKEDTHDDNEEYVLLEVSDDDFTETIEPIDNASENQDMSSGYTCEELELYAIYSSRSDSYRIPVKDEKNGFVTRSISESELENTSYVTGVEVIAVKALEDENGNITGEIVSAGRGALTLETGETVDIQASILTNSPRKGAQAVVDEEGNVVQTSTGTEGLIYHYEYIGDNATVNTDGMLTAIHEGSGRLKVYVYPDTSGYTADNNTGDNTVEIDGEQFQCMDDEDSTTESAFNKLPYAAIRTFVLDVTISGEGERLDIVDSHAVKGILYRILNTTDAAVCGLEEGKSLKTLTIPATVTIDGRKYKVTGIDAYAFSKNLYLEKVSIGKNVSDIGSGAFLGCTNLKKLTLGSGLVQIGEDAFKDCVKISAISLPNRLERIDAQAFYGCFLIKSLVIPASVTYIGDRAFYGCSGLKKITIKSDKLTDNNLGRDVFNGVHQNAEYNYAIKDADVKAKLADTLTDEAALVTDKKGIVYEISSKKDRTLKVVGLNKAATDKLKTLSIPLKVTYKGIGYTVTAIGDCAFEYNTKLTKVTMPKTTIAIGNRAFAGALALKSITIPSEVKTLGTEAFSGCERLTLVTIATPSLTVGDDAFKKVPDTAAFKYAFKGDEAVYKLRRQLLRQSNTLTDKTGLKYEILDPDMLGALLIGSTDKDIKTLSVPDSVNYRGIKLKVISVQDGAFAYHKKLKRIVLGKNVIEICPDAFAGCTQLTAVTMKGVRTIGFSAYKGCTSLKKVTIPKTVELIDNEAFYGCSALKNIEIQSATPTRLVVVGGDAFENISANAAFKISAKKKEDKQAIINLLIQAGVDLERIR